MKIDIISYKTYKKRECPQEYVCHDGGGKAWYRETVAPTLLENGWKIATEHYDLGLFADKKPKDLAIDLTISLFDAEKYQFVYYAKYASGNYYYDGLIVFYKPKRSEI